MARRKAKAFPAGRRQHGLAPGGIRGALLAWLDGGLRLCRDGDANIGAGRSGKVRACLRGPTEDKGSAGRATPTWTPAGRQRAGLVGVARRRIKSLRAGRRQHGRRQCGKGRTLLAWLDGGLRLCRDGDANIGAGRSGKVRACLRGPTEDKGSAGRATPTWTPAGRQRAGLVGVARRRIKSLRAGRRQHGRRQCGKGRTLLAWLDGGLRLCRDGDANMGAGSAGKGGPCWRGPTVD